MDDTWGVISKMMENMTKNSMYTFTSSCNISPDALQIIAQEKCLSQHIQHVVAELKKQYETPYASLALPYDDAMFDDVQKLVQQKKNLNPTCMVVIGIGGSSLGAKAVYQAVYGSFPYSNNNTMHLYFLETIDGEYASALQALIEERCKRGETVLLNVVTKSGTTLETVTNFDAMLAILKRYWPDTYQQLVVLTTDYNSTFYQHGQLENFAILTIPALVGGRYSVFSAVGLFPLMMAGIDCKALAQGAGDALEHALSDDGVHNQSAQQALLLYAHYQQGYRVHDTFVFSVDLQGVGAWYRQLMAESIGKEYNNKGERVCVGMVPTVSVGTSDLHSVVQLYLSGPQVIYTSFVGIEDQSTSSLMNIFLEGTQRAYQKKERSFSTAMLPQKNEYYLGQYLQCKMVEIMLLGYLFDINPFDQPNVEDYKKEVTKLL
jgi:glucose-6-phosphate isomerase